MTDLKQLLVTMGEQSVNQYKKNKQKPVSYSALADKLIKDTKAELFDSVITMPDVVKSLITKFGVSL